MATDPVVVAHAPANFALSKYWGKSDEGARHPAVPSVSACIAGLSATARVQFGGQRGRDAGGDTVTLHGRQADVGTVKRVTAVLDAVRSRAGRSDAARVDSSTDFAVGAGLASSAAGLAAVAAAAWGAAGLPHGDRDGIADVARLGSGSACRSVHGGFVAWEPDAEFGSRVRHVAPAEHWPLEMVLLRVHTGPKEVGSTDGMRAAQTSPAWPAWLQTAPRDAQAIEQAIRDRDLPALAATAETNCLLMHATTWTARPPFFYFRPETLALIDVVRRLREHDGLPCFFTIDAGPNVKVFVEPGAGDRVSDALAGNVPDGIAMDRFVVGGGVTFDGTGGV